MYGIEKIFIMSYINILFRSSLKLFLFGTISLQAFSDPWLTGKNEFEVKKLEYFSIRNQFSIDSSAYPIPLALVRNPNEDMFNNMSLMNEYIDVANKIIQRDFTAKQTYNVDDNYSNTVNNLKAASNTLIDRIIDEILDQLRIYYS